MIWHAPVFLLLHSVEFLEDAANHQLLHGLALAVDWNHDHRRYDRIGDNLVFDYM